VATTDSLANKPGFQSSETSGVEVVVHRVDGDPIYPQTGELKFRGTSVEDTEHSLVSLQTQKTLGEVSGTWSFTLKPTDKAHELFETANDDDWVDISITRHGRKWHVMRGLIDDIRRTETVGGTGATSVSYTVSGRDFGKVLESTPIHFNLYTDGEFAGGGAATEKIFQLKPFVTPAEAVKGFLDGFLKVIAGLGRQTWEMPASMSNVKAEDGGSNPSFGGSVVYSLNKNASLPTRGLSTQNLSMPQGVLWQLAQEYCDPIFNELYVDQLPADDLEKVSPDSLRGGLAVDDSAMVVVLRRKPFPLVDEDFLSDWFELPLFIIPRQQIVETNVGRSATERFNAFYCSPPFIQEQFKGLDVGDSQAPLWALKDINRHGLRRLEVTTMYQSTANPVDTPGMIKALRQFLRDWYSINPYLLNGTMSLGLGRPDIKIGTRIRIPGDKGENDQETYYVESVGHQWQFGRGTRTNLGITRGYVGTDNDHLDDLGKIASEPYFSNPLSIKAKTG
jgi:hypothetical protein